MNAGHNPPVWAKANGELEKLTRTAIALGVIAEPEVPTADARF
ncbi:MAG: SpoIIE family protein phosphatase [Chloroflexi bacterium]|nr:SpoIIE family protein phosphatase [Chloroflexota bacterium]